MILNLEVWAKPFKSGGTVGSSVMVSLWSGSSLDVAPRAQSIRAAPSTFLLACAALQSSCASMPVHIYCIGNGILILTSRAWPLPACLRSKNYFDSSQENSHCSNILSTYTGLGYVLDTFILYYTFTLSFQSIR